MYFSARHRFLLLLSLTILAFALPAMADNVTISGTVNFSSLDGSALDHDGVANGVFTVDDGDLTVLGTINCNDTSSTNACAMSFAVSGNLSVQAGAAIYAENRSGGGSGGSITFNVGGNVVLHGTSGSLAGAIVSSGNADTSASSAGGNITFTAGGTTSFESGSVVSAAAKGGAAGAISVTSEESISLDGLVAAGPSSTLTATRYTDAILSGGSSSHGGGNITILSHSNNEPAISVGANAVVVSQGGSGSAGVVILEGCGVNVNGLVASISQSGTNAKVTLRSGTTMIVDGRDLGGAGTRKGMLRADALQQSAASYTANLFARESVTVLGPASGTLYAVTSNGGTTSKDASGTINVISTGAGVSASGNAFAATNGDSGDQGGTINVSAAEDVTLDTAKLAASGDQSTSNPDRAGGTINVRSYSGGVSWQNGSGDVRPTGSGSGIAAAKQGTITITYCTTVSTAGSSFPTNGAPVGPFPTTVQSCSPAAPSLPLGEQHPDCNDPPIANNDAYGVAEGGTLNEPAPGVLGNDVDPDGDPITAILVSGPSFATSFALNADGSFSYTHDGSENHTDSFTYQASDGTALSNVATVIINITPVNDPPVAVDDEYDVDEGGTLNFAAPGVLANDTDVDGPAMNAVLVSGPANDASFVLNADGSFIYVHDGSETTSDSFTYKVNDGIDDSNVATVTITINPINDAPVAVDDNYDVDEGGTLNGASVLGNDTDAENDTLTATLVSGPANASAFNFNPDGTFTYTHNGGETTSDSFTYKANDGAADSNVATVFITINPVNDPPVAFDDSGYTVNEGGTLNGSSVLANDTDAENDTLTAILVSGPAHALSFVLNPDGTFNYVHDGSETTSDSFTYKANDGTDDSNVATVSITITLVNDPPTAVDDTFNTVGNTELRVSSGSTSTPHVSVSGSVLANDIDGDTPTLTVTAFDATSANGGSVTMAANGSFTYIPPVGSTATDSFNYTVSDGTSTDVGTVFITFTGRVWYVRNNAPAGDGRSHNPFNTLGAAQTASAIGDTIFVHFGDGTFSGYSSGILLKDSQRLIGEGVALVVGPYTLHPAGSRPVIGGVTLADDNTVSGLNISSSGNGISGMAVTNGTISEVDVIAGVVGINLSNVAGTFTLTNVGSSPSAEGLFLTGTANVNATNLSITTSGFTGLLGSGTGTLTINGGSVSTTNGTAVDLSNHTLAVALTSVNATNSTDGIVLTGTPGTFAVNGTGTAGSGGTITGMSGRGVNATNAGGVVLKWMNINNSGQQGVLVSNTAATPSSTVDVQNSSFTGNFSNGVQTSQNGAGLMTITVSGNTFTNNTSAVVTQTLSGGSMKVKIQNNVTTFNTSTAFTVNRSSGNGTVEATITGNVVGASGVPGSGAACGGGCGGINIAAQGSNTFQLLIDGNTIRQFDSIGIRVRAVSGSSMLNATITNNLVEEPVAGAAFGINVISGQLSADTTAVCAHIAGNTITGAYTFGIRVQNISAGSTFSLPGYAGLGTDTTAVANFIQSQNTVATVSATRKTTAPQNQFSGGAACPTPAP